MKIIACLGNPGKKYCRNRHNAGFLYGEHLSRLYGIPLSPKQFSALSGTGRIAGRDVLLLLPQTFMNRSGDSVQAALAYYREEPGNLIVAHDEIELPFGEMRRKTGGGHKGQNGLRSIIEQIKSPDFHRLRIGVGRPDHPEMTVADHVLSNFSPEELRLLEENFSRLDELLLPLISGE